MNRRDLVRLVEQELSGDRALEYATHITQYYRSPGSSGYHQATDYVAELLRRHRVGRVWVERYPLDGEAVHAGQKVPLAWEPLKGELRVGSAKGKALVSYTEVPSCLPWWTPGTPEGGVVLDLVDVGTGERPEDYEGRQVRGKAVLIRGTLRYNGFMHAATLAMQHGAAGIVSDYLFHQNPPLRTREALPEAVQLIRMPSNRNSAWAITVDYNAAEHLAALARQGSAQVWMDIQTRLFKGEGQNLFAEIPGSDGGSDFVMAVCHSAAATKPGANCASGPALLVEMGQVISELISSGRVPQPRRGIRLLVDVERHGSSHYTHAHRRDLDHTVAAIVLDNPGHDQAKTGAALMYCRVPDSVPSFINDYFAELIASTPKETRWVFAADKRIPQIHFIDMPYTPWSDLAQYPVFGVPSPLLMSMPDVYHHTQFLSADKLDPAVFHRCGVVTAVALLELASAGADEALDIMRWVAASSQLRLRRLAHEAREGVHKAQVRRRLAHFARRDMGAVESALVLANSEERQRRPELETLKARLQGEIKARLEEEMEWLGNAEAEPPDYGPGNVVPSRLTERPPPGEELDYWDLVAMVEEMEARDPRVTYASLQVIADEAWNFADGHRTVNQIAEAIGAEFDFDLEPRHVLKLFQGLAQEGHVSLG